MALAASGLAALTAAPVWARTDEGLDFVLTDTKGRRRHLSDFRGKVVALAFGYTQCPDVCPMTLSTMLEVLNSLGPLASRVQVLFVTVDPQRDTQAVLDAYVSGFNPSFVGLRGNIAETIAAAVVFNVVFAKVPGPTPTSYTVDHTAATYLLDAAGRPRYVIAYGAKPAAYERDLRRLIAETNVDPKRQ